MCGLGQAGLLREGRQVLSTPLHYNVALMRLTLGHLAPGGTPLLEPWNDCKLDGNKNLGDPQHPELRGWSRSTSE